MMKKITLLLMFLSTFIFSTYAQQITLFDFGLSGQTTGGNWNDITNSVSGATNLIDDSGASTSEVLTLTDSFDDAINGWGTTTPDGALPFPSSATRDNFFGESVLFDDGGASSPSLELTGGFTLSGLEVGKYYSFKIFASRIGGEVSNRETLYTITGDAGAVTATLDATDNTSNVAAIYNVQPDSSGNITIQCETGPNNTNTYGFYYIGAMEMTKTDTTLSSDSFSINGLVNIYPNPSSEIINISLSLKQAANVKMNVYDVHGKLIKTILNENKPAGSFIQKWDRSSVSSGLYILEINADGKKHNSKLILK